MSKVMYSPEWFALNFVPCPSCRAALVPRDIPNEPRNVFCTECDFSCRYLRSSVDPRDRYLVVRRTDLAKILDVKKTTPYLMVHSSWQLNDIPYERIELYPFIPYFVLKREYEKTVPNALSDIPLDVVLINSLSEIPAVELYQSPSDEEIAEHIAKMWKQPFRTSHIQIKYSTGYARASRIKSMAEERLSRQGLLRSDLEEPNDDDTDDE